MIDDDVQILRVFGRVLGREFTVETETGALEPLRRALRGERYDAILCDFHLGSGMTGADFYEAVPDCVRARIVVCSGSELEPGDPLARALGDRFLLKPIPITELVSVLVRVSQGSALAA